MYATENATYAKRSERTNPTVEKGLLLKRHLNIPFKVVNKSSSQNYILRKLNSLVKSSYSYCVVAVRAVSPSVTDLHSFVLQQKIISAVFFRWKS